MTIRKALRQMSAKAERSAKGHGEALSEAGSDEALRPRLEPGMGMCDGASLFFGCAQHGRVLTGASPVTSWSQ